MDDSHTLLSQFTTFHLGGPARIFAEARSEDEVLAALARTRESGLPLFVLGAGSNILVKDEGVRGVVMHMRIDGIDVDDEGDTVLLRAGAGTRWDDLVDTACAHGLFGIENLAGIPGTVGGAAVQNIGAYGAEFSSTFAYAEVIDVHTGVHRRVTVPEVTFAYRTSYFKEHREFIITHIALRLRKSAQPNIAYADLLRASDAGVPLTTSSEIAQTVRTIRANKFPSADGEGMAGSFFKNPVIERSAADALQLRFPGLPVFPQEDARAKISLAWLLDNALGLKGYAKGFVRLYEKQPIVVVARTGATAHAVDMFAREIEEKVFAATGIAIEREVEMF